MGTPSPTYNFKQPRRFNVVTLLLVLGGIAVAYLGWKIIPVYWQEYKVSEIVENGATLAAGINRYNDSGRLQVEEKVLDEVRAKIEFRHITAVENSLTVYFDDDYSGLNAEYDVAVKLVGGKTFKRHVHVEAEVAP